MSRKEKIRQLVHEALDLVLTKGDPAEHGVLLGLFPLRGEFDYERLNRLLWEEYGCSECGSTKGKKHEDSRLSYRWCKNCRKVGIKEVMLARGGAA